MIFKQLDYLSPYVTFYHKGFLSHSSILSGILSIISFILILAISIYFSLDLIERKNPTAFYFNRFVEDAEIFPLNSSSLFHFVSLVINNEEIEIGVDFRSFRVIGLETYYQNYSKSKNLSNYNHWLYGLCNNESDTKGISHLVNYDFFNKSACIKKYFSYIDQKYYNINETKFRWPVIAHGTYNADNKFYSLILERCEESTINLILGKDIHCRNESEIRLYNSAAHLFYIDNYIDVLNYKNPITKYFYRIENSLQNNNYPINHLNFNPSLIKTHNGLITDKIKNEISYSYERNNAYSYNDDNKAYTVYYFWLNNRMNYYERSYKRIQEIISSMGGIYEFITFVAIFINKIYNKFIVLSDTEYLLNSSIYFQRKIQLKKRHNGSKEIRDLENNRKIYKNSYKLRYNSEELNPKMSEEIKEIDNSKSQRIFITDVENKKKISEKNIKRDNINKNNKSFWSYIIFLLSCEKKYNSFKIYHKFRIKIISEEHLIRNHLNIYNLLRVNEKKIIYRRRNSYKLKDLIKLI